MMMMMMVLLVMAMDATMNQMTCSHPTALQQRQSVPETIIFLSKAQYKAPISKVLEST